MHQKPCVQSIEDGTESTRLLWAKTRVTPIKSKITLLKLELNGASLLAELMSSSITTIESVPIHRWCNSTIVRKTKLENYVTNRVKKIRVLSLDSWKWKHVHSKENPANCASRGFKAEELKTHNLWWKGPSWLSETQILTGVLSRCGISIEEEARNFETLIRIMVYCTRFSLK